MNLRFKKSQIIITNCRNIWPKRSSKFIINSTFYKIWFPTCDLDEFDRVGLDVDGEIEEVHDAVDGGLHEDHRSNHLGEEDTWSVMAKLEQGKQNVVHGN